MSEKYLIELGKEIDKFLKGAPSSGDRPECGDSIGNYDDCYYDGYGAAQYDLARAIENLRVQSE